MNEIEEMRQAKSELARANDAEQVLKNPAFIEAINIMEVDCLGAFAEAGQSDTKKHSEIWLQLNAIKELKENLKYVMSNGAVARDNISFLENVKKKLNF